LLVELFDIDWINNTVYSRLKVRPIERSDYRSLVYFEEGGSEVRARSKLFNSWVIYFHNSMRYKPPWWVWMGFFNEHSFKLFRRYFCNIFAVIWSP